MSRYTWARSRWARAVRLTRYAMLGFEAVEKLPRWPDLPLFRVLQPLPDALLLIRAGGNVEQALIGFGVLHDGRDLPFHREHRRALAFFQSLHKVARTARQPPSATAMTFITELSLRSHFPGSVSAPRPARADVVVVHASDDFQLDLLRTHRLAFTNIRAAPKPSALCCGTMCKARACRSGWPCGSSPRWVIFAPVNSDAEAFGQAATHAPQPIHAAASIARSALSFGIRIVLPSRALPAGTLK